MATRSNGLTVRRVPLADLHLDPSNARTHGPENLDAIVSSLSRWGQAEPLVVQAETRRVIGGNGRLVAMRKLGWTECDVVELALSDTESTALGIALNRTGELATWDEGTLARLLESLRAEDALDGVGFDPGEVDRLIEDLQRSLEPDGAVDDQGPEEPPEEPVSRRGDLWVLGEHRLLCGDSTKADDVRRVLGGQRAALLSTDPPYCVNYTGNDRPIHDGKPSGKDWSHLYREVDIADLGQFLDGVLTACLPEVEDDAGIYMWHAHVQQPTIAAAFERHGLLLHQVLVWVKPTATFGHCYYRWRHEPCAFGWKRGHKPQHGMGRLETVWEADWDGKARVVGNEHPCLHPDALVLTEAGYRPIHSMQVGERVLAADGALHPVTHVSSHPYQSEELVSLAAGDQATLASDNHPFLIRRGTEIQWLRADDVQVGDQTLTPVLAQAQPVPARFHQARPYVEHRGWLYSPRTVQGIDRVPYEGDVWNLSVGGSPTFQTAVGMSHNTQKPTRLFEIPIEQHTASGAIVLEPFSGSGSQLIAAQKLGRRCRAIELQPAFVDAAVRRYEKATGQEALLDGKPFAQVAAERGVEP